MQKIIRFAWLTIGVFPALTQGFSTPQEKGLFLKTAFGYGQFLYAGFNEPPNYTIYSEQFSEISGMIRPDIEKQIRYEAGLGIHRFSTLQKACTNDSCQDAKTPNDRTTKVFLSPYFSFNWDNVGLLIGFHTLEVIQNAIQPRFAVRLGPVDRAYISLECLNGQSFLTEGLFSMGLGMEIKRTEVWLGWNFWPYHGPGISGKMGRNFGLFHPTLTGHLGSATENYHSEMDNYPPVHAKLFEYGISLGLEYRIN